MPIITAEILHEIKGVTANYNNKEIKRTQKNLSSGRT